MKLPAVDRSGQSGTSTWPASKPALEVEDTRILGTGASGRQRTFKYFMYFSFASLKLYCYLFYQPTGLGFNIQQREKGEMKGHTEKLESK